MLRAKRRRAGGSKSPPSDRCRQHELLATDLRQEVVPFHVTSGKYSESDRRSSSSEWSSRRALAIQRVTQDTSFPEARRRGGAIRFAQPSPDSLPEQGAHPSYTVQIPCEVVQDGLREDQVERGGRELVSETIGRPDASVPEEIVQVHALTGQSDLPWRDLDRGDIRALFGEDHGPDAITGAKIEHRTPFRGHRGSAPRKKRLPMVTKRAVGIGVIDRMSQNRAAIARERPVGGLQVRLAAPLRDPVERRRFVALVLVQDRPLARGAKTWDVMGRPPSVSASHLLLETHRLSRVLEDQAGGSRGVARKRETRGGSSGAGSDGRRSVTIRIGSRARVEEMSRGAGSRRP